MRLRDQKTNAVPEDDRLYQNQVINEDFAFNERIAEVFDDMLSRSIPFYDEVIQAMADLVRLHAPPGATVYDLGCSTGSTLLELSRRLDDLDVRFIGIDNAPAMLSKARAKAKMFSKTNVIAFTEDDITRCALPGADVILCNYTMQFLRPVKRPVFLRHLYESLSENGILLLSEKVIARSSLLNRTFINMYHQFKRQRGYSELEIAAKREALENILIPFSIEENKELLIEAGFPQVETFFQWFNFASIVALKQ